MSGQRTLAWRLCAMGLRRLHVPLVVGRLEQPNLLGTRSPVVTGFDSVLPAAHMCDDQSVEGERASRSRDHSAHEVEIRSPMDSADRDVSRSDVGPLHV